jgi:hypothetical protein
MRDAGSANLSAVELSTLLYQAPPAEDEEAPGDEGGTL